MTPDQLAAARANHWREDGRPILTLDDAKAWLERMTLCLYLPRKAQLLAPAPSFVGAVLGASSATPPPETIQQAHDLLVRLVAEGFVVPLNLFGNAGDQPDFLVVTAALPHLAALQADRTWKKPPSRTGPGKVSPLAIEIWKLLEREGALTAGEVREQLGHELTEAATIRGLSELWQNLRVAPLPQENGAPAVWEILSITHKKEMAAGGTMSQSAALSMLVSDYVQSVITATAEDIEAFLSPVASRSRLRDVIRGLGATRQLKTLSMDAQTFLFIEGTLPDMPESSVQALAADKPAFMGRSAYRERMLNKTKDEGKSAEDTSPKTYQDRRGEAGAPRRADGPGEGASRRPSRFGTSGFDSSRTGTGRAGRPGRPSFSERARSGSSRPPFRKTEDNRADTPRREDSAGERSSFKPRPFSPRNATSRPPYRGGSAARGDRPFRPRPDGDRPRSFTPREGGRANFPGKSRNTGDRPRSDRPVREGSGGEGRPRTGRPFAARPSASREGSRPPFRGKPAAGGDRPFRPRPAGDKPFRENAERPYRPRAGSDRPSPRPFTARDGDRPGSRPPFRGKPAQGDRPLRPAGEGRSSSFPRRDSAGPASRDGRRESGSRPTAGRTGSSRFGGDRSSGGRPTRPSGSFTKRERSPSGGSSAFSRPPSGERKAGGDRRPGPGSRTGQGAGRPSSGGRAGGPPARLGAAGASPSRSGFERPGGARPGSSRTGSTRPGTPGRNPGGTGRPGGQRPGSSSSRPGGGRPGGSRPDGSRPGSGRPSGSRPGGMRPPTRKPRPDKDSE